MTQTRFNTLAFEATITRPADTTTYAAGDAILGATGIPFVLGQAYNDETVRTNPNLAPLRGGSPVDGRAVQLNSLKIVSSQSTATPMQLRLHFFAAAFTGTDNAALSPTLAQLQDYHMGTVRVLNTDWVTFTNGNICWLQDLNRVMIFPEPSNWQEVTGQIWVVAEDRAGYVPASAEVIKLSAIFTRD